jgi:hypothetical protein
MQAAARSLQVLLTLCIVFVGLPCVIVAGMAFDSPKPSPLAYLWFTLLVAYAPASVVARIVSGRKYQRQNYVASLAWCFPPLLLPLGLFGWLIAHNLLR